MPTLSAGALPRTGAVDTTAPEAHGTSPPTQGLRRARPDDRAQTFREPAVAPIDGFLGVVSKRWLWGASRGLW